MSVHETKLRDILIVFIIGMTAGISPFLFMQVLPSLLNPNLSFLSTNWTPIVITGVLIGIITTIIFASEFHKKEPQEIFFYALGIPAVLIAAVSNLSTQFEAQYEVSEVKNNASAFILSQPEVEEIPLLEEISTTSSTQTESYNFNLFSDAYAENTATPSNNNLSNSTYLVTIGEYVSEKEARKYYENIRKRKLKTEKYLTKRLQIYKIKSNRYVIAFSDYLKIADARKAYKLLRVNDPDLRLNIFYHKRSE